MFMSFRAAEAQIHLDLFKSNLCLTGGHMKIIEPNGDELGMREVGSDTAYGSCK